MTTFHYQGTIIGQLGQGLGRKI